MIDLQPYLFDNAILPTTLYGMVVRYGALIKMVNVKIGIENAEIDIV